MNAAQRLSNHITRTVAGPMWHGPALSELLEDVTPVEAAKRPIGAAHSIWELVLHIAAWAEIARSRLREMPTPTSEPTAAEDWPPVFGHSKAAWEKALARMETAYRKLAEDTTKLDARRLTWLVPGRDYSVGAMLHGVIEHGTYHGGQIALLKKALTRL